MNYKGYIGKVEVDEDAGIIHGEIVGIQDVITFQGRSIAEVRKAFMESVDDYLAFCRQRGENPNKPHSGKFVVRIGSDLHRRLDMAARISGKSLNTIVAEFLEKEANSALLALSNPKTHRRRKAAS
ncbi:MAG: type II toxin-antitoxin system HicB family antitoxin [Planctomycetes bacterium]|nr:type II toxin-antitoxin system HicB family antitoxin [Planctomycetota bacterium]